MRRVEPDDTFRSQDASIRSFFKVAVGIKVQNSRRRTHEVNDSADGTCLGMVEMTSQTSCEGYSKIQAHRLVDDLYGICGCYDDVTVPFMPCDPVECAFCFGPRSPEFRSNKSKHAEPRYSGSRRSRHTHIFPYVL